MYEWDMLPIKINQREKKKFNVLTGRSMFMQMLTRSGWQPTNEIESTLVQIQAEIMSDENACLEKPLTNRSYNILK